VITTQLAWLSYPAMVSSSSPRTNCLMALVPATLEWDCRLENVSISHPDKRILDSVSIEIPAGCITVLMGPSGAGKTTIADFVLGLYPPDRGRARLDGVPLDEIELCSWRRSVGYVPQELVGYVPLELVGYVPQQLVRFHDSICANVVLGDAAIGEADVRRGA
jgi:ATP-binding cassette subfamily C protein